MNPGISTAPLWLQNLLTETLGVEGSVPVSAAEQDANDNPMTLIAASTRGVAFVEFDGEEPPEVRLLAWREVRAIRLHGALVSLTTDAIRSPVCVTFETAEDACYFVKKLQHVRQ